MTNNNDFEMANACRMTTFTRLGSSFTILVLRLREIRFTMVRVVYSHLMAFRHNFCIFATCDDTFLYLFVSNQNNRSHNIRNPSQERNCMEDPFFLKFGMWIQQSSVVTCSLNWFPCLPYPKRRRHFAKNRGSQYFYH